MQRVQPSAGRRWAAAAPAAKPSSPPMLEQTRGAAKAYWRQAEFDWLNAIISCSTYPSHSHHIS